MNLSNTHWIRRVAMALGLAACLSGFATPQALAGPGGDHDHAEHGPHKGNLIELGDEEYHGELVHDDDTHTVTIYLLDATAKKPIATDSPEVLINLVADGKPKQFKIPAQADAADPAGKSSRFALKSEELCGSLDDEKASPRLKVSIDGKSYMGKIEHDHDHDH